MKYIDVAARRYDRRVGVVPDCAPPQARATVSRGRGAPFYRLRWLRLGSDTRPVRVSASTLEATILWNSGTRVVSAR